MDTKESVQKEFEELEQCPTRELCPFGFMCGVSRNGEGRPLLPRISRVKKGDLLWTNLRFESQVYVIRKGVFVSVGIDETEETIPYSILGKGNCVGLCEMYTPPEISEYYHIRSLVDGEICSTPAKIIKHKLQQLPQDYAQQLLCCVFVSQAASTFTQSKILSRRSLFDRILSLLLYLQDMTARRGVLQGTVEITHEEIATLVASDRVSTTRVLHKMAGEGLITIGYKSITLHNEKLEKNEQGFKAHSFFVTLKEESEHLREVSLLTSRADKADDPYIVV